jgi:hypothetical protein
MSYPTPMDVAESDDTAANALDAALDWPYSREAWDQVDAERLELLAANEALAARQSQADGEIARLKKYEHAVNRIAEVGYTISEAVAILEVSKNDDSFCHGCGMKPGFDGMWHKLDCPEK